MADWFYTDALRNQVGPVDEQEILRLNHDGTVTANTLIWREGMSEWAPLGSQASQFFGRDEDGLPVEYGICAFSRKLYPLKEMLPYGEALIGVDEKGAFVQHMMETGLSEIKDATETNLNYVGFWWRTLSSTVDYLAKMIPSWICMIPYYVVVMGSSFTVESEDFDSSSIVAMGVAYGFGLLGILGFSIFYETWMVGKYGGTLGKLAIGARVVDPKGVKLSYKKAFVRWLAKKPLNLLIIYIPSMVAMGLMIALGSGAIAEGDNPALAFASVMGAMGVAAVVSIVFSGVYWMAAFDHEKRALHDRVAGTRVVKK